jgi:16S rRNA C1402 N4-methylase RsmH
MRPRAVPAVALPAPGRFERLRGLPDKRVVDRLLRGRLCIWVIGVLLGGIVAMQVDTRERGFSYAYDAPLDMRMDPDQELTAAEIVNTWERRRIARLLREYGEERFADRIAT